MTKVPLRLRYTSRCTNDAAELDLNSHGLRVTGKRTFHHSQTSKCTITHNNLHKAPNENQNQKNPKSKQKKERKEAEK